MLAASDVRAIIDTALEDGNIEAHIAAVETFVDEEFSSSTLSSDRIRMIKLYLTAHFVTLQDPQPAREKIGPYSISVQGTTSENLKASHYGQMAMLMDTSGILSGYNAGIGEKTAEIGVIAPVSGGGRDSGA